VLQSAVVSCRVLQCAAACCSMLQCVAVCCSILQCAALCCIVLQYHIAMYCSVLQCVAVCCRVLQRVAVCCTILRPYTKTPNPAGFEQTEPHYTVRYLLVQVERVCEHILLCHLQCIAVCIRVDL